ncbi:hypothetical protein C8Q77DRAFT_818930 [Trametes polyzona]|nr:hypothetical protein C8Q77DRAFT_818930 [Trametes polyzona]
MGGTCAAYTNSSVERLHRVAHPSPARRHLAHAYQQHKMPVCRTLAASATKACGCLGYGFIFVVTAVYMCLDGISEKAGSVCAIGCMPCTCGASAVIAAYHEDEREEEREVARRRAQG